MNKWERIAAAILFLLALTFGGIKFYKVYLNITKPIAGQGGTYSEAIVGEAKYLSPILAQSDAEKAISSLLFSGLVKVVNSNQIVPDLASDYQISPDGLTYTFTLRDGILFSDGSPLTANDVAFTIDQIKSPSMKSPLSKVWTPVTVKVIDEKTISFSLPNNSYGPFLYNCNVGILPSNLSLDQFNQSFVGSGPFKFSKLKETNGEINEKELFSNGLFYGQKPYLGTAVFHLYQNADQAINSYENDSSVLGLFGADSTIGMNNDYTSSRQLGLIFNLRSDKLKDINIRQKIIQGTKLDSPLTLNLATLDLGLQVDQANKIKAAYKKQNINVNVQTYPATKFNDVLNGKKYDLILYGFDYGYDRDPYTYWHTSQLNNLNLAGWSDKNTDILLEGARLLSDVTARNTKYDQFFDTISKQYVAVFYDPIKYNFELKDSVKDVESVSGNQPSSRFTDIANWYINEKRVKK